MRKRVSDRQPEAQAAVQAEGADGVWGIHRGLFTTTHWSVVLAAGGADSSAAGQALETLCRAYWRPIYAYLLRQGLPSEQAKDLTQDYFRHLITSNLPAQADPERGKFRSFLLLTLKHFFADQSRRARRGRCIPPGFLLPLEASDLQPVLAETCCARGTPEAAFDRTWARTLVNETRRKLEAECLASGKQEFFQEARDFLPGGQSQRPYVELAQCLKVDLNVAKVRVHRLRQRFAEILREEIAQTVSQPGEVDEEVRYLIDVLSQTESGVPCPET